MPLHVEAPQVTKLLTDYGKSRVEELKNGKDITPELMRRMKMLVSQDWWATRLKSFKIFSWTFCFERASYTSDKGFGVGWIRIIGNLRHPLAPGVSDFPILQELPASYWRDRCSLWGCRNSAAGAARRFAVWGQGAFRWPVGVQPAAQGQCDFHSQRREEEFAKSPQTAWWRWMGAEEFRSAVCLRCCYRVGSGSRSNVPGDSDGSCAICGHQWSWHCRASRRSLAGAGIPRQRHGSQECSHSVARWDTVCFMTWVSISASFNAWAECVLNSPGHWISATRVSALISWTSTPPVKIELEVARLSVSVIVHVAVAPINAMRSVQFRPLRYLETMAKNLDDGIDRLESDAGKISGRSARIKRRVDMILEEIRGVQLHLALNVVIFYSTSFRCWALSDQSVLFRRCDSIPSVTLSLRLSSLRAACQNCMALASDPILTAEFGITEARRLELVRRELMSALADAGFWLLQIWICLVALQDRCGLTRLAPRSVVSIVMDIQRRVPTRFVKPRRSTPHVSDMQRVQWDLCVHVKSLCSSREPSVEIRDLKFWCWPSEIHTWLACVSHGLMIWCILRYSLVFMSNRPALAAA